jgi:hypothetical protein
MPRRTAKTASAATPLVIRTNTLDTLSDQLDGLTQALLRTQKEAQDAKSAASSAVANNADLRKEIAEAKSDAAQASTDNANLKRQLDHIPKPEKSFTFNSKGNEDQYNVVIELLDINFRTKLALSEGKPNDIETKLLETEAKLLERKKCILMADEHPSGWAIVREYLGKSYADTELDDAKIKKAEASLEIKLRRKFESVRGSRGGRGTKRGRYNNTGANAQVLYYQEESASPQVYQLANVPVARGGATASVVPYVQRKAVSNGLIPVKRVISPGKPLGPCYHCQGPHLIKHCPELAQQTASVQAQIESLYYQ